MNTQSDPTPGGKKKQPAARQSKDGKWRSFTRVPHLLQYVSSGTYFARIKLQGKIIRQSLDTDVWTTAQLRLVDFLKAKRHGSRKDEKQRVSFGEAAELYRRRVESDPAMKTRSKEYRFQCLRKIEATWPGLNSMLLGKITGEDCREWASTLQPQIASQYFNNVTGTLRLVFNEGIKEQIKHGGSKLDNPAKELVRARIHQKALKLPERDQFKALVSTITEGSTWGPKAAKLVEFLAYSGMRLYTEAQWVAWEDIDWKRMEIIVRGHPLTGTKNWEIRRIPILPDMEELLKRIQAEKSGQTQGKLLEVVECPISLKKACADVGIPKLRHHDMRHLFATRCIESGVDVPTVSRWLDTVCKLISDFNKLAKTIDNSMQIRPNSSLISLTFRCCH